MVRRSLENQ
jgi:hypothetical protein